MAKVATKPVINMEAAAHVVASHGVVQDRKGQWPDGLLNAAAKAANCTAACISKWQKSEKFWKLVDAQRMMLAPMAMQGLMKSMKNGNSITCRWVMTNLYPEQWDDQLKRQRILNKQRAELQRGLGGETQKVPTIIIEPAKELKIDPEVLEYFGPDGGTRK